MSTPNATLTHARRKYDESEPHQRPLGLHLIARLMRYSTPFAAKRNALLVLVVVRAIQVPLIAATIAAVIDGPIQNRDTQGVFIGTAVLIGLALIEVLVLHYRMRYSMELGESVVHDLRYEVFTHIQRMPMSFFTKVKRGRIISRITSDIENVRLGVQDVLFSTMVHGGQMFVAAMLMLWTDRVLFGLLLVLGPAVYAINRYYRPRLSQAHRNVQESFARVIATLAESVAGIRVTQSYVRQDTNAKMFHDLVTDHSGYHMTAERTRGGFLPLLDLNSQLFMALLLAVGGYRVLLSPGGDTSIGDLAYFILLSNMFFSPIITLGRQYNTALTAMAGAERIFDLLDTPPEWTDTPDAIPLPPIEGRVEMSGLCFEYETGRPILQDINFVAEPGQTIALVGHTGSGKTTLASLIARFYLPTSGQLLIDGHDTQIIQGPTLHSQMGIVLQTNFLFTGTVMDNIRYGKPDATDDQVIQAAQALDCHDVIESLTHGYDTEVGESGAGLSLGQRQLVCFARAMLANPRILILDEATSAVDTITESKIQQALTRLLQNRTSFVIAHRLSTIRHADAVLVIDQGRIVEQGTHNQLLKAGRVYADLYRQFIRAGSARGA